MKSTIVTYILFAILVLVEWPVQMSCMTTETPDGGGMVTGDNETMEVDGISPGGNVTMETEDVNDDGNMTSNLVNTAVDPTGESDSESTESEKPLPDKDNTNDLEPDMEEKAPANDNNNKPAILVPVYPAAEPPSVPYVHYVSEGALCMTNADCNVTNAERCTLVKQDVRRCQCLAGHSRGSDGFTCVASKVYFVELKTEQPLDEQLKNHASYSFRKFKYEATDGAIRALQSSKLSAILVDARVSQLSTGPSGHVTVKYDVMLLRSYVPDRVVVTSDIRRAFLDKLVDGSGGVQVLEDTSIPVTVYSVQNMRLRDVNACDHPLLNYCAPTAVCVVSARSFTCRCKRGYTDTSPDILQAPGEQCTLQCGCKNGGECQLDEQGILKCNCPHWYLGSKCGIDVRILLIVMAAVVGVLLLLAVICCACCLRFWRKRHRQTDDISSVYSLPRDRIHMHKVPSGGRAYYDTWRYYSFGPPTYNSKWPTMVQRPHQCPSFVACRRSAAEHSTPIELVPPGYGTYSPPIPRPHVLPSASLPRPSKGEWVWSATDEQESSYA